MGKALAKVRRLVKGPWYFLLLGLGTSAWIALLIAGILVDSQPLRANLSALLGGSPLEHWPQTLKTLAAVIATYTYTNVCLLAMAASFLGGLAATVNIGPDSNPEATDNTYPRTSSLLRGFLIALALLAGVLLTTDGAFDPSQSQYYKTAGFVSLTAFLASVSPDLMKRLLDQFSSFILQTNRPLRFAGTAAKGTVGNALDIHFANAELVNQDVTFTIRRPDGTATTTPATKVGADGTATVAWTPQVRGKHRLSHPTSAEHAVDVG
jgi:hypothetical protein